MGTATRPQMDDLDLRQWEAWGALAPHDEWTFLTKFFRTHDEHDPAVPAKVFPQKAVYRIITRVHREAPRGYWCEKSRQVMFTWTECGLMLHDTMFKGYNRRNFLQSKKEEDAAAIIARIRHGYDAMRDKAMFFEHFPLAKQTGKKTGTQTKLDFPETNCILWAIPQGDDVLRSYTASNIFSDEIAHQEKAKEAFAASTPTLSGGGRFIGVGTPNGHAFNWQVLYAIDMNTMQPKGPNRVDSRHVYRLPLKPPPNMGTEMGRYWIERQLIDMPDDEFNSIPLPELIACMPGMAYWITCDDTVCLRVHYSADPDKSPETTRGRAWIDAEKKMVKDRAIWLREYEINYDTYEGIAVIGSWDEAIHVKAKDYVPGYGIRGGVDFGGGRAVAFLGQKIPVPNFNASQARILAEVKLDRSNTYVLADRIVDVVQSYFPQAWDENDLWFWVDPAGMQRHETTSDQSLQTSVEIMEAKGLRCKIRKLGVKDSTDFMRLLFAHQLPNGEMAVVIHPRCEYAVGCFGGGLHYPDKDDGIHTGKYEKDGVWDHGGDAGRHLLCNLFTPAEIVREVQKPGWEAKIHRQKGTGRPIGVIRRRIGRRR